MIRVTLLTLFSLFFVLNIHAQRDCGSMDLLQQHLLEDPKLGTKMDRIEEATRAFLKKNNTQRINGTVTIPVVVHVVYNTAAENISTAQINSQIQILNEDFRRNNSDADNVWSQAADAEIEFCLATVDPQGNATNGITRTSTTRTSFGTNDQVKFASSGGKDAWPAADYMNVWVCDISGSILGYAQFPGGAANTDGVVNDYLYFGNIGTASAPFDLGRTMTHEVGHYLNLRHIWGDGGCNVDDFVSDTPTSDASNGGCALGHVSCGTVDMVQNYMDYSDDACMNLFTSGQKSRMRALFDPGGARESLLSSGACGTPPPAATCTDGIQNGNETGVDCGGPDCAPCSCSGTNVTVSITLDNYPEETSWSVTNSSGTTVASGGTYANQADGSTVSIDLCLADGCYDFVINDSYGDGICCSYGNGSYTVSGGGSTLASGGNFGSSESTNFCLGGSQGPTCTDGIQNGNETGVDCGGPDCPSCPVIPTCDDGIQNGSETGVDCGGPDCPSCPVDPTCDDGIQNGSETGVDCGGPDCDPCNTGGCTTVTIDSEDFESSIGIWNDGGSDCQYINSPSYSNGSKSVRLRDNTGSSVMTTDNLALAGFEEVTIDFSYMARSMENGEDFWLQASTNGGSSYTTLATWARGTDFNNQVREDESVVITGTFTNNTRFRFRNDASSNADYVYIDDINISGCTNGSREAVKEPTASVTEIDLDNISKVKIYPNPTTYLLNIEYDVKISAPIQINVIDMAGKKLMATVEDARAGINTSSLEVGELNAGIYYVHINNGEEQIIRKFVVIK